MLKHATLDDPLLIIGADQFADFPTWKEPDGVIELARLGVATRPWLSGERRDEVLGLLSRPERVELFDIVPVPVSSSDIRDRVARGEPIARPRAAGRGGADPALGSTDETGLHFDPNGTDRKRTDLTRTSPPNRRPRPGQAGERRRHPRHAAGLHVHRLLRRLHGTEPAADDRDPRRGAQPDEARRAPAARRGRRRTERPWIVADYLDVVLHIFTPEARSYYPLENLWGDVPPVEVAAG